MKHKFLGHYKPTEAELSEIWDNALFILDTNVLLDFFRLSEKSSQQLFEVLEKIQDRLWLPYQVAKEYHKNLNKVISDQVSKYNESIEILEKFDKLINEKRNHPFLDEDIQLEIVSFCEKIENKLREKENDVKNLIVNNPTKEKLCNIFTGKIGNSFSEEEMQEIYKEGEERYKQCTPPGYKDKAKGNPERYGDLIIWKQILGISKEKGKPIILITSDIKEDWFLRVLGMTVGPRPELIEEFTIKTENKFYLYTLEQFLNISKDKGINIEQTTIEEVKDRTINNGENLNQNSITVSNDENTIAEPNTSETQCVNSSISNNTL